MVFIAEPKIRMDQVPISFWKRLNLKIFMVNDRDSDIPSLWGICSISVSPYIIVSAKQHITVFVKVQQEHLFFSSNLCIHITYCKKGIMDGVG